MKQRMFAGFFALGLLALGAAGASAQGCGPQGCGPKGGCSAGCCFSPCIDVYKPCISIPQLRIPVFCPSIRLYCEPGAPKCGAAPWYEQFPQQPPTGYNIGGYGAFNGPVGLGAYSSYGNPMAGGPSRFGPPGAGQMAQAPAYWYGR